ncbi:frataxin homolog, mitochondrial [Eurytemora carolleeae]|uniref:frataxin homolog, mitochondrial n=1 Tax=Eurytemora carolleeae TaxID=1294199 RepID=UPI000C76F304|nr:frataxin homolog, mitochondrial [Eurytemora carolleeae]|eukprot:XP_023342331.1 frataxin homolog, mitochondrial-like [Eurytemora affinis]
MIRTLVRRSSQVVQGFNRFQTLPKLQTPCWQPQIISLVKVPRRTFSTENLDEVKYTVLVNETLESLGDKFSEIIENHSELAGADATLSHGVLTINLGGDYGVYVINKQTPNKQIWLSSPISGPQRFDFVPKDSSLSPNRGNSWVYAHTGDSLHQILDREIGGEILKTETGFQTDCFLGGLNEDD